MSLATGISTGRAGAYNCRALHAVPKFMIECFGIKKRLKFFGLAGAMVPAAWAALSPTL